MIVCLRAAAIASVMAVVASTSVMAQTTGTIPPQPPPYGVAPSQPPPTANQYSSNEIIDAGHHFFGSVSHGLCQTAIFLAKRPAVPLSAAFAMATARYTPEMPVTSACTGKDRASALTPALTVRGQ